MGRIFKEGSVWINFEGTTFKVKKVIYEKVNITRVDSPLLDAVAG